MKKTIKSSSLPQAIGAYSQGVIYGQVVYLSGQLGMDKSGQLGESFEQQLQLILKNLENFLQEQSLSKEQVLKSTIFLTDLNNFPQVNQAYEKFFAQPFPARSCVEVSRLPKDALIEIEFILVHE